MPTAREVDKNGFLTVKGCPISSFGIFDYGAGQLGLPGDPNRIVKVFRPESAVSDPEAIASFMNVPLINDHEMLSGFQKDQSASAPEDYGVSGVLTSNVYYEAPWMRGDLKFFGRDIQGDLQKGKKDLSLGYSCDFEVRPGVFDGQAYEVVQTNLRGNHIALVDEGRVPGARVLDGLCFDHLRFDVRPSDKEDNMAKTVSKKTVMDNAVEQLKALLPALQQFLTEEGTEPAHQEGGGAGAGAGGEGGAAVATPAAEVTPEGDAGAGEGAGAGAGEAGGGEAGGGGGEGGSVQELIANVEAVLAQLKSMVAPAADAEAGGGENPPAADGEGAGAAPPAAKAGDEVEGLATGKGEAMTADSALKLVYADMTAKAATYERLSRVVGAFDHSTMDSKAVAAYGVKKLNLKCSAGQEGIALDAYLTGIESAHKATQTSTKARAADSAAANGELDAYLKGTK